MSRPAGALASTLYSVRRSEVDDDLTERTTIEMTERCRSDELRLSFDCYAVWPKTPHSPLRVRLVIGALAANLPATKAL